MTQFALRYPEITFDTRVTNERVDLVAEGFDLAIRSGGRLIDSALTARRLGAAPASFYAAPSYLARHGRPRTLWSSDHHWIAHRRLVEYWKIPTGRVRHLSDDMTHMRELAREGAGIAFVPDHLAAPYVRSGELEHVELANKGLSSQVWAVYPSSGQVPRKVIAFRDLLVEWLGRSPLE